ncbi:MAG: hypothetical protein KDA22_11540 [Phycisphaerales bacterium]|nr:hypothetical protein [Phycisphaerales bacterium]
MMRSTGIDRDGLIGKTARGMLVGRLVPAMVAAAVVAATVSGRTPAGTHFTYQGLVRLDNAPLNATADLEFRLFDDASAGMQLGETLTWSNVAVADGLVTVDLDFGADVFSGSERWIEVAVRSPAGDGAFTTLSPRQPLTAAPYALQTRGIFVNEAGSAGIGTVDPVAKLHVAGQVALGTAERDFRILEVQKNVVRPEAWTDLVNFGGIAIGSTTGANRQMVMFTDGFAGDPVFTVASSVNSGADWTSSLTVLQNGYVGIGTADPSVRLQVSGGIACQALTLDGGADLSEGFVVVDEALPGMVVAIDPDHVGALRVSQEPYDMRVAGIVSGAGGVNPGVVMGQKGSVADGDHPVALSGRVYCWVDADANGAVRPGDLLTTSSTPGHAMKATDPDRAHGAVIGKAMSPLDEGTGLVLVLVNLQ